MDILSSIEQESAVLSSEKWKKRPRVVLNTESRGEAEGTLIQFTTPCPLYNFVISSAKESGGTVLMLDFDNSVKMGHLLKSFSMEEIKASVRIHKANNWHSFSNLFDHIPYLMFENPNVAAVIVFGLANPYLYYQKRKSDQQIISKDNFVYQILAKTNQAFSHYKIPVFVPKCLVESPSNQSDEPPSWPSFIAGQLQFVRANDDEEYVGKFESHDGQVSEINCISKKSEGQQQQNTK